MPKMIDLTGQRFGRLTVLGRAENKGLATMWECLCDCGNLKFIASSSLRNGITKSCGCLQREMVSTTMMTHGKSKTSLYNKWHGIKQRCENQNNSCFKDYGGRGIKLCDEWQNFDSFQEWALENGYQDELTIERINNNGNYEPGNCKWVTRKEQGNNKRNNRLLSYKGETKTMHQWSEESGVNYNTLYTRLQNGWSVEKALTTPTKKYKGEMKL